MCTFIFSTLFCSLIIKIVNHGYVFFNEPSKPHFPENKTFDNKWELLFFSSYPNIRSLKYHYLKYNNAQHSFELTNFSRRLSSSFVDHLCYLCLVFVMFLHLFSATLWSPSGKGLTSWLSFVMFNCVFVTFQCGILGQVWYLIVSISDLCHLSYFKLFSLCGLTLNKSTIIQKMCPGDTDAPGCCKICIISQHILTTKAKRAF